MKTGAIKRPFKLKINSARAAEFISIIVHKFHSIPALLEQQYLQLDRQRHKFQIKIIVNRF